MLLQLSVNTCQDQVQYLYNPEHIYIEYIAASE